MPLLEELMYVCMHQDCLVKFTLNTQVVLVRVSTTKLVAVNKRKKKAGRQHSFCNVSENSEKESPPTFDNV